MAEVLQSKRVTLTGAFPAQNGQESSSSIWSRFSVQLDASRVKFAAIARIPEWGSSWSEQYAEAFQDFNKLWSTQQRYRHALTQAGLTRWTIGEIASRIGQLYYNYYTRKSDTSALHEAFSFYDAIRSRQYFHGSEDNRTSLQQQLRYHARFLLVCLLLQDLDKASLVAAEMQALAMQLSTTMGAKNGSVALAEWSAVASEAWACIEAETLVAKTSPLSPPPPPEPRRLTATSAEHQRSGVISNAIFISYRRNQLKLGALTMDAMRLSQALEWQMPHPPPSSSSSSSPPNWCPRSPRKLLFYQAPASHIQSALGATLDSMPLSKTLLVYIGADAWPFKCPTADPDSDAHVPPTWSAVATRLYEAGVALSAPHAPLQNESSSTQSSTAHRLRHSSTAGAEEPFEDSADGQDGDSATKSGSSDGDALAACDGNSPSSLPSILPSVQVCPPRKARGWARQPHSHDYRGSTTLEDTGVQRWPNSAGNHNKSAPAATGDSLRLLDCMGAPNCISDPHNALLSDGNDQEPFSLHPDSKGRAARSQARLQGSGFPPQPQVEQILLPEDLVPATRRNLLVIADSNKASIFERLRSLSLAHPPLLLLSPHQPLDIVRLASSADPLLTLFLSDPVLALVRLFRLNATTQLTATLNRALDDIFHILNTDLSLLPSMASPNSSPAGTQDPDHAAAPPPYSSTPWDPLLRDPLARRIILRFVICRCVYARASILTSKPSSASVGSSPVEPVPEHHLPQAHPQLPSCLSSNGPALVRSVDCMLRSLCLIGK